MKQHNINGSHYGFSAARIDDLGSSEYTLATISADVSGSVGAFEKDIERCIKEVVRACGHSPRADNLMLRTTTFASTLTEIHGFVPLTQCHPDDYDGALQIGGNTALYDAAHNSVSAITSYSEQLSNAGLSVNAIAFVITDGMDNGSQTNAKSLKTAMRRALKSEALESLLTVLVGVGVGDANVSRYLKDVKRDAGFSKYIELDKADATTLAKLAHFVRGSIIAQSRALGSGGISQSLIF